MTLEIEKLAATVRSASRIGLLRTKPVFRPYAATSSVEFGKLEEEIGTPLPNDLRDWLLALGYGDLDEELSFRREWLASIDTGHLKGGARFAQDALGNFYAFDPQGCVFFLSRSESVFAMMSNDFRAFIEELVRRDYKLADWLNTLETQRYDWK